ncbi:hypothetical protein EYF80_049062 [Liparis tanakae]|uniref:Uncharacterized protein n=1 Tax=Liparis tanakae TaxID=230148 RepID=A0A4Z2FHR5_9TELE|nr:hypothetical protein EYF80_049062 [Liparis tanakae]
MKYRSRSDFTGGHGFNAPHTFDHVDPIVAFKAGPESSGVKCNSETRRCLKGSPIGMLRHVPHSQLFKSGSSERKMMQEDPYCLLMLPPTPHGDLNSI